MARFMRRYIPALLVLVTGLTITTALCQNEQHLVIGELRRNFQDRLHETGNLITQSLKAHETMLRGVQGLFAGSDQVDPQEFRDFINAMGLGGEIRAMRGIGYCQLIDRKAILKQIEPDDNTNHRQVGFDFNTVPALAVTMDRARDTGMPVISGKLWLTNIWNDQTQPGFAFFLPLFRKGASHDTLASRKSGLWGWVYAPFDIKDLLANLYTHNQPDIRIQIFDDREMTRQNLLFDNTDQVALNSPKALFSESEFLEYSGHTWTIRAVTTPEFEKRFGKDVSGLIAWTGTGLSFLAAILVWLLESSRIRALSLANSMTRDLRETKERFELIFNTNPDATILTRLSDEKIVNVNESFVRLSGYALDEVIGKSSLDINLWVDPNMRAELFTRLSVCGECHNYEAQLHRKDGSRFAGMISAQISTIQGIPHMISVTRDISQRKASEEIIHHMAHYDALTDLPNRALFTDRLLQALAKAKRNKSRLAVIFIDLDRFKPVNDQFGHQTGDLFLKEVARRILGCLRESDTIGRIGGDEFVVLISPVEGFAEAKLVADKLCQAVEKPYAIMCDRELRISASAGIALFPDDGTDDKQLIKNADLAMYRDKHKHRQRKVAGDG